MVLITRPGFEIGGSPLVYFKPLPVPDLPVQGTPNNFDSVNLRLNPNPIFYSAADNSAPKLPSACVARSYPGPIACGGLGVYGSGLGVSGNIIAIGAGIFAQVASDARGDIGSVFGKVNGVEPRIWKGAGGHQSKGNPNPNM